MITHTWDDETVQLRDKKTRSPGFFKPPIIQGELNQVIAPKARVDRQVSARVFPNGEFGVGFIPQRGISAQDRRYERDRRYAEENAEIVADIEIGDHFPEGFRYTRKEIPGIPPKLGLGSELSQPRKKYGLKGITGHGRRMVRNGGTVLDTHCRGQYNRRMAMGTVTVPSYSPEDMKRICTHWGDIVRVFFQRLKRQYGRYRYDFYYTSVTEIQPKRLESRGEVGLHLHFLFVAIRLGRGKWVLPDSAVRLHWEQTIKNYLGQDTNSQSPNYRRDMVNSSSAGYMAKYLSKGGEQVQQVLDEFGEEWLPSQWWSMDNTTRKCIKHHTISSRTHVAEMLLCICSEGMTEYLRYKREVTMQTNPTEYAKAHNCPTEILLGYGGMLTPVGLGLFTPPDRDESIKRYLSRTLDSTWKN